MSVRPNLYLVIGCDDIKPEADPRYKAENAKDLESLSAVDYFVYDEVSDMKRNQYKEKTLSDLLYNPEPWCSHHFPNITGLIIEELFDSNFVRAVATLNEKYLNSQYKRIRTLSPKAHPLLYKHYDYTKEDVKCNRFVPSYFENYTGLMRADWKRALHYLHQAGWMLKETELRYLIILEWE